MGRGKRRAVARELPLSDSDGRSRLLPQIGAGPQGLPTEGKSSLTETQLKDAQLVAVLCRFATLADDRSWPDILHESAGEIADSVDERKHLFSAAFDVLDSAAAQAFADIDGIDGIAPLSLKGFVESVVLDGDYESEIVCCSRCGERCCENLAHDLDLAGYILGEECGCWDKHLRPVQ